MSNYGSNYAECAHAWAHQIEETGANYGNRMFFVKGIIYSYGYHYVIAQFATPHTVLFNAYSNSNTTNKQRYIVRNAISHKEILEVVEFMSYGKMSKESSRKNLDYYWDQMQEAAEKERRSRSVDYTGDIFRALRQMEKYVELFRCKSLLTPSQIKVLKSANHDNVLELLDVAGKAVNKAKKAKNTRKRNALRKSALESIEKWLAGDRTVSPYGLDQTLIGGTRLRVREAGVKPNLYKVVETSKGIQLEYDEAKRVFQFIAKVKERGEGWRKNGQTFQIARNYQMDSVTSDGDIVAGCHSIKWSEIERIAIQENWL